jgi:antitoxin component YwqK of YwqJK toxin-antitoxin module
MRNLGEFRHGQKHGLWTTWDYDGRVEQQVRYAAGVVVDLRREPPWWGDAKDQ